MSEVFILPPVSRKSHGLPSYRNSSNQDNLLPLVSLVDKETKSVWSNGGGGQEDYDSSDDYDNSSENSGYEYAR